MNQDVTVGGIVGPIGRAASVAGERDLLDFPVNSGFLEGLERGGLRVCKSGFDAAFGKNPTSTAGMDEEKLDAIIRDPIANRGYLLGGAEASREAPAG